MPNNNLIFADSNYFVALFNPADTLNKKAANIAQELDRRGVQLAISNFIFLETVTVLAQKRGRRVAIEVGEFFLTSQKITILHIDQILQEQSWSIFCDVKRKNVSFVDCSIIAAIKAEGIRELLTFDVDDFEKFQKKYHFKLFQT